MLDASSRLKILSERNTADYPQGVKQGVKSNTKKQNLILSEIRKNPSVSFARIAAATGLSIKVVEKMIDTLKKQDVLVHVGPSRGGHWVIHKD